MARGYYFRALSHPATARVRLVRGSSAGLMPNERGVLDRQGICLEVLVVAVRTGDPGIFLTSQQPCAGIR